MINPFIFYLIWIFSFQEFLAICIYAYFKIVIDGFGENIVSFRD